jgi:hypothetical protein
MRHHHRRFFQASLFVGVLLIFFLIYFFVYFKEPRQIFESASLPEVRPQASFGVIQDFFSGVTLIDGNSVQIKEVIKANFNQQQDQFVRVLPYRYKSGGVNYKLNISDINVGINNQLAQIDIARDQGSYLLTIKNANNSNFNGFVKFNIDYKVSRIINYLDDNDQLVYLATGYQWPVSIERARAIISLPFSVGQDKLSADCHISQAGQLIDNCQVSSVRSDSVGFDSLSTIAPGQGMLISFSWPKNVLSSPDIFKQFWWLLRDNPFVLFPFVCLLLFYFHWLFFVRQRWYQPLKPTAIPPPALLPVEVGTIFDNQANIKDVLLILVEAGRRGFLTIRKEVGYWLIKKNKEFDSLSLLERRILDSFFADRDWWRSDNVDCRRAWHDALHLGKRETYQQLVNRGFFPISPASIRWFYVFLAIIIWITGFVFVVSYGNTISAVAILISGFLIIIFGQYVPPKSPLGQEAWRDIGSYRLFIKRKFNHLPADEWLNHISYILLFHGEKWAIKAIKKETIKPLKWFVYSNKKIVTIGNLFKELRHWEKEMLRARF